MRTAAVIVLVAVAAFFVTHGLGAAEAMRLDVIFHLVWGAFFTALSFLTTTGFVSTSWRVTEAWSGLQTPGLMMLALALVGGGIATSAGGVKLLRVYALYRHGQRELERLIEPSSVGGRGSAARQLRNEGAFLAFIFFVLFAILIGGVTASLTVLSMELEPALVLAIAALTNTGPVAESFGTGLSVWAGLTVAQQSVLAVGMVLGRLEMLAVLAFLAPDSWRR
jgi:trk system potassium uptake protein TrkH